MVRRQLDERQWSKLEAVVLVDCYERNDDKTSAKRIPIDTDITAHGHAGVRASMSTLITSGTDDWYRVVLDEPRTVRLVTSLATDRHVSAHRRE